MVEKYLKNKNALLNKEISRLFSIKDCPQKELFKAAFYSVEGGKKLRPIITLAVAEPISPLRTAIAIELIHAYSCIHDDLPCMDNDSLRRGKPTLHKKFPEWLALLTGDFLLTYAFELISGDPALNDAQKVKMVLNLSRYIGGRGMIAGQVADLRSVGQKIGEKELKFMHIHKTADLFAAAALLGAIAISSKDEESFISFGKNFGLAYQIVDDILDATSEEKTLGKPVKADFLRHKPNAVSLWGIEKAKKKAQKYTDLAIQAIPGKSRLKAIAEFCLNRIK